MIPFSFWAKAVHTLVDVLQVPTGLEGKSSSASTVKTLNNSDTQTIAVVILKFDPMMEWQTV